MHISSNFLFDITIFLLFNRIHIYAGDNGVGDWDIKNQPLSTQPPQNDLTPQ